jgi:tetratricopeptide (TPR) repeat protein
VPRHLKAGRRSLAVTPERYKQVRDLADAALDQPEAGRAAFFAAACGADEVLRAEVSSLLASLRVSFGYLTLGDLAAAPAAMQESLAMREKIAAQNPGDARAQDRLAWALAAIASPHNKAGDRAAARRDYLRAHAIYTDISARGYGGAHTAAQLGMTELSLGELEVAEGRRAEACQPYRRSAALYDQLAARDAMPSVHTDEAEQARRAAAACGR